VSSLDELIGTAAALVADGKSPACQLAVARDGDLLAFETFGGASNESRFCVFSATKPIVASMVWLLIGEGSVEPAQRVVELVPEFATQGKDAVTVEQVLLHTAGFPNASLGSVAGADPGRRRAAFRTWELEWEPGSRFEYHPLSAHWVLADIVERITGLDFREAIERRVSTPLGLPRLLGIPEPAQGDVVTAVGIGEPTAATAFGVVPPGHPTDVLAIANDPTTRAAGVPGGGGLMTAASMARFYQALLHNPGGLWDGAVLEDATANIRCRFDDPMLRVPVDRSLGLVLAGDDGLHQLRYAVFGAGCSPGAFGHAGAFLQVAWADPATGTSFAFVKNGCAFDMLADAANVLPLADLASRLD
jgi:CubicO group peptidase (beta-lactamase class C family)